MYMVVLKRLRSKALESRAISLCVQIRFIDELKITRLSLLHTISSSQNRADVLVDDMFECLKVTNEYR